MLRTLIVFRPRLTCAAWLIWRSFIVLPACAIATTIFLLSLAGVAPIETAIASVLDFNERALAGAPPGFVELRQCLDPPKPLSEVIKPDYILDDCRNTKFELVSIAQYAKGMTITLQSFYAVVALCSFCFLVLSRETL